MQSTLFTELTTTEEANLSGGYTYLQVGVYTEQSQVVKGKVKKAAQYQYSSANVYYETY